MSRGRLEQQLAALDSLKSDAPGPGTEQSLRKALTARNNYYVSKAASVVEELGQKQLIPELLSAYLRFFEEDDPQCWAKNALARALGELGHDEPALVHPDIVLPDSPFDRMVTVNALLARLRAAGKGVGRP